MHQLIQPPHKMQQPAADMTRDLRASRALQKGVYPLPEKHWIRVVHKIGLPRTLRLVSQLLRRQPMRLSRIGDIGDGDPVQAIPHDG